jgi:uncharacterized membrane protein
VGPQGLHYLPISPASFLVLAGLFAALVALVAVRLLQYAYASMGIDPRAAFAILFLSLAGSYVNIPVMQLPAERVVSGQVVDFFGMRYVIPVVQDWPATIVAVNLGGALIPVLLSLYLVYRTRLYARCALAVALVAAACHASARLVPGLGIVEPVFAPALATAVVALMLSRRHAAAIAYVAGGLGALIGADLLNLGRVQGLGAPVVSIGGAGTFDGIFVNGLMAVLIATLARGDANVPPARA